MNNRVRALESLVAIFLLGLIIGLGGTLLWVDRGPQNTNTCQRSWIGGRRNPVKLSDLLHLTPEQDAKIKAIFDDTRRQSATLSKEMGPKFEAIRAQTNGRIAALLNDEQKKIWEEYLRHRDESRDRSARGEKREDGGRGGSGLQPGQGSSGPRQQPRGNSGSLPERGPDGSQLPLPARGGGENRGQPSS
jgi:hypothetical protein